MTYKHEMQSLFSGPLFLNLSTPLPATLTLSSLQNTHVNSTTNENKSMFHVFSLKLRISFSVRIVATDVDGIVPTSVIAAVTSDDGITSYMMFAYCTL